MNKSIAFPKKATSRPKSKSATTGTIKACWSKSARRETIRPYVPAQDKNRTFGNQKLGDVCDTTRLPSFGYQNFLRSARTVDVIWFNRRDMPAKMFEVEMSTDMRNSLTKFNELRDFYTQLKIVAPNARQNHFADRIEMDTFHEIRGRVKFMGIDELEKRYSTGRL